MELLVNDLSIRGQFHDLPTFYSAIKRLMGVRNAARRWGRDVHCYRALVNVEPIAGIPMQRAIQGLAMNDRRALMGWLTRGGPFWDDFRHHSADDLLEHRGEVVTDSAIGEAAYRTLHGVECGLVSATPSDWDFSPIEVIWNREDEGIEQQVTALENWRDAATMEDSLQGASPPVRSWTDLRNAATNRFGSLTFSQDCFEPLAGVPFARSSADRILVLLGILDRLARAFDVDGGRTPEGQRIYQDYFTGDQNAWFSDSSDSEKNDFRRQLTFPHPNDDDKSLFCPWHGKERRSTLRLHFSWPIRAKEPAYVVYVGPKLTRR